ncbi:hypothetical protein BE221DRAFT_142650 [Ostreococcus tauri]|nr:hypothetical protein BE221DRAFT_142650 [Ostreococcus tauri]
MGSARALGACLDRACAVDDRSVVAAARYGHGAILDRLLRCDRLRDGGGGRRAAIAAAAVGRTTTLANHLREYVDASCAYAAAKGGHLRCVKFLCENCGVAVPITSAYAAAAGGHAHVMRYALQNAEGDGVRADDLKICAERACEGGHWRVLEVLRRYAIFRWSETYYVHAARFGQLFMFEWLEKNSPRPFTARALRRFRAVGYDSNVADDVAGMMTDHINDLERKFVDASTGASTGSWVTTMMEENDSRRYLVFACAVGVLFVGVLRAVRHD